MKAFQTNNSTIHYRVSGKGNPVLFLHGFLEDHSMWDNIAPALEAEGFTTYLIDLPGHGLSRFSEDTYSMARMAEVIDAFCSQHQLNNPYVFGHSMGGYVGLELIKLRPIKLTLIHSNFWEDPPAKKQDRNRVVEIVRKNKMRLIAEAIPNLFAPVNRTRCAPIIESLIKKAALLPSNEIIGCTKGMRDRKDNSHLLNEYEIDIIHGPLDSIVKTELLHHAISQLNQAPILHLLKNCGHMSIWEHPQELINSLKLIVFR